LAEVSFGEWLKRQRGAKDWTQRQLAQKLNCSFSALRKMEAEERHPSMQVAERLIEIFHIPQSERKSFLSFARGDWQAFVDGEGENAPWRIPNVVSHSNLPTLISSFIGREQEQNEIVDLLKNHRLVTLVGAGGIGKTRLALQVGQKLLKDYPNGVWFIPLDSLSDPALVPQTVAAIFGIREGMEQPILETLINVLREKTTLLIIDNCEHLLDACAHLIKILLTNCSLLKILATSRETLGIVGGVSYATPSLSIPERTDANFLNQLTNYEAIQLFVERAALIMPSFRLSDHQTPSVVDICRTLDGIPLAIELAAAHVDILQVNEILQQLNHCLDLLISNNRTIILKHQTMRASLDWSWGLLNEAEQIFLRQLSVFAGGWTLESSQAVCDGDVLNLTSALTQKSLIVVDQGSGPQTRYHFHEIVRQYTWEKLTRTADKEYISNRHLQYFLQFAEQAEVALRGPEIAKWRMRLRNERDNIRSALEWADKTNVEAGLYLSGRLEKFWEELNLVEGARWLMKFIQKAESADYPHAKATALHQLAWFLQWMGESERARRMAKECLELFRACDDKYREIDALTLVGTLSYWPVSSDMWLLEQALQQAKVLKDNWRQAYVLSWMGQLAGSTPRRATYWQKAISLYRKAGDIDGVAGYTAHMAYHDMSWGNIESAYQKLNTVLALNQQYSLQAESNYDFLSICGQISTYTGDYEQAHTYLQEALRISEDNGRRMNILWLRINLGLLALQEGQVTEARSLFTKTSRDFQQDKNVMGVVSALEGMAGWFIAVGNFEHAAWLIGWADMMRTTMGDKRHLLGQGIMDKFIADCIGKMGEVAFSDAYDEGQKMTLDEAVRYALEEN
jgi:predicted ATPase/DNA-binding XRE family transcriptional regulator